VTGCVGRVRVKVRVVEGELWARSTSDAAQHGRTG
jgi:hypothetical protein